MSTELITVGDVAGTEVVLAESALELRNNLLQQAQGVTAVVDALDAEFAASVLKDITSATKDVENARKSVKAPVLDLGKRIDETAKEFSGELDVEKQRISGLLGTYEAAERKKQQEAERRARAEEASRMMAAEEAAKSGDENAMADAAQDIAEIRGQVSASAHRPSGTVVRETWQFEVTDIKTLYAAAPHLCNIEPNGSAIRAVIKHNQDIAGLRIWKEAKSHVR